MLEVPGRFYPVKRYFGMALPAVLSEPVFVYVPVAVRATFMGNPPEIPGFFSIPGDGPVAFCAIKGLVFPQKPETGIVVVESGGRPEGFVPVAGDTIHPQGSLVEVVVAIRAFLPQPQVSACPFPEFLIPDEFLFMTLAAIDSSMSALKRIPSQAVIELVPVETDHLKIPAVMIVMAGGTFLPFHLRRNMIAAVGIDPRCDLPVAVQAFLVGNLLAQDMAFHTVGHPFQVFMCFCEVTRA
jgi:hypothetical protein